MFNNVKLSLFLAYRSMTKGNKSTLLLIIFIMSLIFVNLVFIGSIFLGVTEATNKQVINSLYSNIVIEPKKDDKYISDVYSLEQKIKGVPGVVGISSQYVTGATLSYKDKHGTWGLRSINPDDEMKVTTNHNYLIAGNFLSKLDDNEILLGKEISGGFGGDLDYSSLGVKVGDSIDVQFDNGVKKSFKVKGIFDANFIQTNTMAYISQKGMESVYGLEDKASQILVKTRDNGNEDRYVKQFQEMGIKEQIKPWTVYAGMVKNITNSFDMIAMMITAIGLFVAVITIFIIVYTSTISKRKQIGILRAVGIEESIIIQSYIFQALFIVVCGIFIGLIIIFFAIKPYFIEHPLKFPIGLASLMILPEKVSMNVISLIIAAIAAGFIPSWMAVRKTIIDTIWGD
ncbi:MAG: FtsX-like permease family protein [Candidatus Methanoperedens sp.]|nr:FtsX-like permease family protein [Candidatus Methanoperedens sp.]